MKQSLFILSLILFSVSAQLNYQTFANWDNAGCATNPTGGFQSPIDMSGSPCKPYENFQINYNTPGTITTWSFDSNKGAYTATLSGLSLTVDSQTYTGAEMILRTQSEHIITNAGYGDLELQIRLTGGATPAFLSFVIRTRGNNKAYNLIPNTFVSVSATTISVNLQGIVNQIKENVSQGNFLNLLTYIGTQTYPESNTCPTATWYVYGTELFTDNDTPSNYQGLLNSQGAAITLRNGNNNRLTSGDRGGNGKHFVMRLCFTGYFRNHMNENYGLWFGVVIITGWFIINLILGDKPIKDTEYQENTWTHHPFVSIYTVGSELFSRKQRMSLLLVTITVHALFSSVWYRIADNKTRGSNLIVFAIYSMLINWAVTTIIGLILRGYTIAKNQFYKTREEAWDQRAQNRIFAFYFSIFIIIVVGWPFTVWNMGELHAEIDSKPSDYWVASFFIGLGLEFLIVDPIICLLAKKVGFIRDLLRFKGYFYDNLTHETYLTYLKLE